MNVGTIRNGVDASIGAGAVVASGGSTEVIALSRKDLEALSIGAAVGAVAATGSIGIFTIGGNVDTTYNYNSRNADGSSGANQGDDALGDGASGWNGQYDGYANGSSSPGGSNGSILNSHAGDGGSNSRVSAALAGAQPKVGAAKPKTSITAQLAGGTDLQGTTAHVDGGASITASVGVKVLAQDATTVTSTVGSFSGGAVSLGAPVTVVNLNMAARAIVGAGVIIKAESSVAVAGLGITAVKGFAFAGQGGAAALGAQVVVIKDNTSQTAELRAGAKVTAGGDVIVTASAQQSLKARAFGATFSAVGVGVSLASAQSTGVTQAFNDGTVTALKNVTIAATATSSISAKSFGVGVALGANLNGAVAIASTTKAVSARTGPAASTTAGGVITVSAATNASALAESDAISVGLGAGLGISFSAASLKPTVSASAGGTLAAGSGLTVLARFDTDAAGNKLAGLNAQANAFTVGAGLIAGAAGAIALTETSPTVLAQISDNAIVGGRAGSAPAVTVQAFASDEALSTAKGLAFGLGAGLGASITSSSLLGSTTARIGIAAQLGSNAGAAPLSVGDVIVQAKTSDIATAISFAAAGGLVAGASVNAATARIATTIAGRVEAGAVLHARSLSVLASEDVGTATTDAKGIAIAGVGAVGFSQATATHATVVRASVGGGARALLDLDGNLTIAATTANALAKARSDASGGALLASVQVNKATANSTGSTTAALDDTSVIGTTNTAVKITAVSNAKVDASGSGRSLSLIAGIGDVSTSSLLTDATLASVGAGVNIGTRFDTGDGFFITYVGSVEVSATSSGSGTSRAEGAAGGLVAAPKVSVSLSVQPTARATVGDGAEFFASGGITVASSNRAEGDATLSGNSVGLVAVGSTSINHQVSQTAETLIAGGVLFQAQTITLTSNGGADPSPPRNYTTTADAVVASSDSVVINGHGLQTGDIVQLGTAGSTYGGLSTGRILPIIALNDNTVRFGRFVSGDGIDAARDTITFAGPHFMQTGDKVLYGPAGGPVAAYWVNVVSDTAIKLLDFDPTTASGIARLTGLAFTKGGVSAAADTITIAGHGLADGTHVTYRAARTKFAFGVGSVDVIISGTRPSGGPQLSPSAGSDNIYLPGHTYNTGDLVTYTVTGGDALGGLVKNTVYQVVRVDDNFIQLKPKAGGSVIAISADTSQLGATHTLTQVGSGPLVGLVDGDVYVVKVVDADTIKLTDLNGTLIDLGTAGAGSYHLARDGIDLLPTAATQQVYLDLQAGGTATLLGVGGVALDTIIADPGDGVSRVTASGLSVGLGAVTDNLAAAHVTSTVRTIVAGEVEGQTQLTAVGAVTVSALGKAYASAVANGDAGGLFAFPNADAEAIINGTTEALIGEADINRGAGSTSVYAGSISITATALYGAEASSGGGAVGLIADGGSNGKAATTYLTRAGLGQGATTYADDTTITAHTSHTESTNIRNSSGGLGAGSSAGRDGSGSFASGDNTVLIGFASNLRSGHVALLSLVDNSAVTSKARSYSASAIGGSHATATAKADDQVGVVLMPGSVVHADRGVSIQATVGSYNVVTNSSAELDALGGGTEARSDNFVTVRAFIDGQQGATVEAKADGPSGYGNPALFVTATATIARDDSHVDADGAFIGSEDETRNGSDNSRRDIVWNADVVLLRDDGAYKRLEINSLGVVVDAIGITVDGGQGVGYNAGADGVISVDNIAANDVGRAIFRTNDGVLNSGTITGTAGKWTVQKGASSVSISNYSNIEMDIHDIDTLGKSTALGNTTFFGLNFRPFSRAVSLESTVNQSFNFDISTVYDTAPNADYGSSGVFIGGYSSGSIVLDGLIDNPLGYTYVDAGYGSILQGNDTAVIRSNYIQLSTNYYGGSIGESGSIVGRSAGSSTGASGGATPQTSGTYYIPVKLEFVQSAGRPAHGRFYANQVVALDVATRLRDPGASSSTVTFDSITSRSSTINVNFRQAQNDTILPSDAPYGIVVGTTQFKPSTTISDNAYYREFYKPDFSGGSPSPDALAAFGVSSGTVAATYNITSVSPRANFSYTAESNVTVNLPLIFFPVATGNVGTASSASNPSARTAAAPASTSALASTAAPAAAEASSARMDATTPAAASAGVGPGHLRRSSDTDLPTPSGEANRLAPPQAAPAAATTDRSAVPAVADGATPGPGTEPAPLHGPAVPLSRTVESGIAAAASVATAPPQAGARPSITVLPAVSGSKAGLSPSGTPAADGPRLARSVSVAAPVAAAASLGREVVLRIGRMDLASEIVLPPTPAASLRFFETQGTEAAVPVDGGAPQDTAGDDLWTLMPSTETTLRRPKAGIAW